MAIVARQTHPDVASGRRELDGVGDQVRGDSLQLKRIACDQGVVPQLDVEPDLFGVGARRHACDGLVDDRRERQELTLHLAPSRHDLRDVEEVFDQPRLCPGVAFDGVERACARALRQMFCTQQPRPAQDGVEGSAQLVRHHRQELVLRRIRRLQPC